MKKSIKIFILILLVITILLFTYYIFFNKKENKFERHYNMYDIQDNIISEEELNELIKTIPYFSYINSVIDAYNGTKVYGLDAIDIIIFNTFYTSKKIDLNNEDPELLNNLDSQYHFLQNNSYAYLIYDSKSVEAMLAKYHLEFNVLDEKVIILPNYKVTILNNKYTLVEVLNTRESFIQMFPIVISNTVTHEKDKLILEEKKLFVVKDNETYKVYRNTHDAKNNINPIAEIEGIESYADVMKDDTLRTITNFTTFKSIFNKDENGEYYWYSTEMIK